MQQRSRSPPKGVCLRSRAASALPRMPASTVKVAASPMQLAAAGSTPTRRSLSSVVPPPPMADLVAAPMTLPGEEAAAPPCPTPATFNPSLSLWSGEAALQALAAMESAILEPSEELCRPAALRQVMIDLLTLQSGTARAIGALQTKIIEEHSMLHCHRAGHCSLCQLLVLWKTGKLGPCQ